MGIIDSLSAGYRFTLRRLWLLVIPILLDLLLWLAPRLSIAPIVERFLAFYNAAAEQAFAQANLPAELVAAAQGNSTLLQSMADSFNLLTGLVSGLLLHMPSLALTGSLPASARTVEIASATTALGLWLLLLVGGVLLGVIFLGQAAQAVPLGAGAKPADSAGWVRGILRHWSRVLLFALLAGVGIVGLMFPASVVVGILMLALPSLGLLAWGLMLALMVLAFIFLYFVTAAVVLDDLGIPAAVGASVALVRRRLLSVLGLVLLINIIGTGMALLLAGLAALQPVGTVAAILINAFIGTGMAVGLLVFYRSGLLREAQADAGAAPPQ